MYHMLQTIQTDTNITQTYLVVFEFQDHYFKWEVDDDMASLAVAQLLYLESLDPNKDIQIYINSPGGSVTAGMAIYDTMQHVKCDVSTICVGLAASMGAFLLAGGTSKTIQSSKCGNHDPPAKWWRKRTGYRYSDRCPEYPAYEK